MQTAHLPDELADAIQEYASRFSTAELAAAASRLSEAYRRGLPPPLAGAADRAAYLVTRLPATYAALKRAAAELPFEPQSWLDLGAGAGAAAWVARCPTTLVDANAGWHDLLPRPVRRVSADLTRLPDLKPHDVVSLAYVLNELPPAARPRLIEEAWRLAQRALVVVEPGTPAGFAAIAAARRQLLEAGANLQAPCPHSGPCPLEGKDWCHFAVRVERSRLHRQLKGGSLGYEDEKFSYLCALRPAAAPAAGRILRRPEIQPNRIRLTLCTPDGVVDQTVTRRDPFWRASRKASWGDRWPPPGESTPEE
jgi:ribosomal protein RSM22 (predicted rRNA methylase)